MTLRIYKLGPASLLQALPELNLFLSPLQVQNCEQLYRSSTAHAA